MSFDPRYYIEERSDFAPTTDVEKAFEKLDSNGVRWVVERALKSDEEKQAGDRFQSETVPLFKKMYPAYIDNEHNMKLMQNHWRTKFKTEIPSLVEVEETFLDLRNAGVVNLNAKAVAKEQADVIAQRHDELIAARKEAEFDETAAYTMPFDQLEKKARGFNI
jgi:hypothetical protein